MRPRRTIVLACALLLPLALAARADAQAAWVDEYSVAFWGEDDGLPFGRILCIEQDATGYLWLGTDAGLVRFDGVRFVRWTDSNGLAPRDGAVGVILSARDGSLWIGLGDQGGVARIQNDRISYYGKDEGIQHGSMTFLLQDSAGAIWTGDREGIYRFQRERWENVGGSLGLSGQPIYAGYEDRTGDLWISAEQGLYRRRRATELFERVSPRRDRVESFAGTSDGRLWLTDARAGFTALESSGSVPTTSLGIGHCLLVDTHGHLWIGTLNRGLWRVQKMHRADDGISSDLNLHAVSRGLPDQEVRSIHQDRAGNIWVGTTVGLYRLSKHKVIPREVAGSRVVHATPEGGVWVGTTRGLIQIAPTSAAGRRSRQVLQGSISSFAVDRSGSLWITGGGKLWRRINQRFVELPMLSEDAEPIVLDRVHSLGVDSKGAVWIADFDKGMFVWRDGRLSPLPLPEGVPRGRRVLAAHVDGRDGMWVAFSGGTLLRLDGAGHRTYTLANRFGQKIMSIYEGPDGAMWIGGTHGLTRIRRDTLETVTQEQGLPGDGVSAIVQDSGGDLWLGVATGIVHVRPGEFDRAIADHARKLRYQHFDTSDGLAGMPTRWGYPSAVRDADGRLWFVTGGGLTAIDPSNVRPERQSLTAVIERATAGNEPIDTTAPGVLPPRTARLVLDYTALNVTSPRKVRFRYRMDGVDSDWVEAGQRRTAAYTNLNAGTYRFHLVATSSEGDWTESESTWPFTVRPAFAETAWPYVIGAVALGAMISLVWRLRLRHLRTQFAQVAAERARISRELHDTLLQGMIGVTLQLDTAVQTVDPSDSDTKRHLLRIQRQIQECVRDARESIRDLRSDIHEQPDIVASLRDVAERVVSGTDVHVVFTTTGDPRPCAAPVRQQLLRIAHEAVTNAVRHAHADKIELRLEYQQHCVTLSVRDNGRGFVLSEQDVPNHYGLVTMRERAEQLGGTFRVTTAPGAGTVVEAILPSGAVA